MFILWVELCCIVFRERFNKIIPHLHVKPDTQNPSVELNTWATVKTWTLQYLRNKVNTSEFIDLQEPDPLSYDSLRKVSQSGSD